VQSHLAVDISTDVLTLEQIDVEFVELMLRSYGLDLVRVDENAPIPGTYWGEPEAGLIGNAIYARGDTPGEGAASDGGAGDSPSGDL